MKLDRLTSVRPLPRPDTSAGQGTTGHPVAPVAAVTDADADRRRSLQQELGEVEASAIGPFEGRDQVQQSAHELAERLASLGSRANDLVGAGNLHPLQPTVDDQA